MNPLVSVILPTRNSEKIIRACLDSLAKQTYPDVELLVVDNHSHDRTAEIAKEYGARVVVGGPAPPGNDFFTAPLTRRLGGELAKGGYLFFVDSDMILQPNVVAECVELCRSGAADAVTVKEIPIGEGFWSRCKILERYCYLGDLTIEAPRFFPRPVYDEIGGWQAESGGFDDWATRMRLEEKGKRIAYTTATLDHNEGRLTAKRVWQKKYFMGKTTSIRKHRRAFASHRSVKDQVALSRVKVLARELPKHTKRPDLIAGVFVMKAIEGAAMYWADWKFHRGTP